MVLPCFLTALMAIVQFGWAQHKLSSIRFAMEAVSRQVMLDKTLTQQQVSDLVHAKLTGIADPNVTITLTTATTAGGQVATMTGGYVGAIGVPGLASLPINWTTQVSTSLPSS